MKLKYIKKVIFNTIVAMLTYCFLVQPVYATTTYSIGDYKKFPQERSNWCWAASAQCSGYYLNPVPLTQTGAVLSVKGRVIDEAGSIFEIAEAANYFTMNKYNYVGYEQAFPIALFSGKIMKKHIPIACGGYYRGTRRTGGHATPVHMVYVANDNSKLIGYYDPADNKSYQCYFNAFCDGSYNNRRYDMVCFTE